MHYPEHHQNVLVLEPQIKVAEWKYTWIHNCKELFLPPTFLLCVCFQSYKTVSHSLSELYKEVLETLLPVQVLRQNHHTPLYSCLNLSTSRSDVCSACAQGSETRSSPLVFSRPTVLSCVCLSPLRALTSMPQSAVFPHAPPVTGQSPHSWLEEGMTLIFHRDLIKRRRRGLRHS